MVTIAENAVAYLMRDPHAGETNKDDLRLNDENVPLSALAELGITFHHVNMETYNESEIETYAKSIGMVNRDVVRISRETLPDFDGKLKMFYEEHLHTDPEVRFILEGRGFFDVRDKQDRWIRIPVASGDVLFLPSHIFHRFTTDEKEFAVAMRFFRDAPCWIAHNRADAATAQLLETKQE